MKQTFKRITAVVLSAALSLSLINFSFIGSAFAKETVGYGIDVEYAQDNSSATLVGNTSGLKENIQLEKLVDENGQELDPASFSQTVEENGSYHFTLYYQESVASEDAAANASEETVGETTTSKTEELEVVVDGIVKPEPQDEVAQNTAAEGATMLSDNGIITAVPTVPLDVLQRSVAESRATSPMTVDIYAYEVEFKLSTAEFSGGELVAGAAGLPSVEMRDFYSAVYRPSGSTSEMPISGLYFYNNNWYYTIGNSAQETVAGNIGVGFLLPDGASVRFYYKVTTTTQRGLEINGDGNLPAYNVTVNGVPRTTFETVNYPVGTKVILEFILPPKFQDATISSDALGFTQNMSQAASVGTALTEKKIVKITDFRYALVFTMPDQAVTVMFAGVNWPSNKTYSFGLGTYAAVPQQGEQQGTGSYFKSLSGTTQGAGFTTTTNSGAPGWYNYNTGSKQTLKIAAPNGGWKDLNFAVGTFAANTSEMTFGLRMDRYHTGEGYTWKASVLRMDVYLGEVQLGSTDTDFRRYLIPLPMSAQAGQNEITTEFDFGATVTTTCVAMEDRAYQYTIKITGMVHSFKLWDNPVSTVQENFFVENLSGIKVASDLQAATDASYVNYRLGGNSTADNYALQLYNTYMGKEKKTDGYIDFYVEPMYGYTQPSGSLTNSKQGDSLSSAVWSNGKYQFRLKPAGGKDGNKSPARISFTAQPLSLAVKYFYNGSEYYDTNVTMTATANALLSFDAKLPQGLTTAQGYQLKVYYTNSAGVITEADIIPNSARDNELWYPNEDIISFSTIYDYMKGQGTLPTTAKCILRIVPENGTGVAESVEATYEIKTQTGYQALDSNQQTHLEDTNSTTQKGYVSAYVGSTVNLVGYVDQFQTNGKKYKLYTGVSTASGTVQDSAAPFATLEYVLATTVSVDTSTLGGDAVTAGGTWNTNHANTWYTSVNGFGHTIDLTGLNVGTKDAQKFVGWAIKGKSGTTVSLGQVTSVNLYTLFQNNGANANQELWSDIFNSGTCTLVAMWEADIAEVKSEGGRTIGDLIGDYTTENPKMILEGGDGTLTITADFSYLNASATQTQLQEMVDNGTLNLVLLKKAAKGGVNYSSQWQVEKTYNSGDSNITGPVIGTVTTGNGFVNFSVSFTITSGAVSAQNNGASFKIQAWTSANRLGSTVTAQQICEALNNGTYSSQYAGKIPGVSTYTEVLYKIVNNGSATGTLTVTAGSTGFTLSATEVFEYHCSVNYGPDSGDTFTSYMLQQLIEKGKIQVTLEKQVKGSSTWETVSGVGKTALSAGENGAINFTYEITDSNLSAYDGVQFKITLWTDANGSNDRATHTITVTYVSDPTAYVDIPKFIVLEDDQSKVVVGDVKQSGYAGKQVEVKYNQNTMAQSDKPSISVAVQDGVKMRLGGVDGTEQENMAIGIYDTTGKKLEPESGYSAVGTLSNTATSLSFWMNVPSGTVKNEQYFATVTFRLELINSVTEFV